MVVVTIMDVVAALPRDGPEGGLIQHPAARLIDGIIRTAVSSTSSGHLILVTLGLSLCDKVVAAIGEMVVNKGGWESFSVLPIQEFEGYPSAINQARLLAPPDSILAVFTPLFLGPNAFFPPPSTSTSHNHSNATGSMDDIAGGLSDNVPHHHHDPKDDLFVRYEEMVEEAREKGGHMLVTIPPLPEADWQSGSGECPKQQDQHVLRLPVLMFDDKTFEAMGPFDQVRTFKSSLSILFS